MILKPALVACALLLSPALSAMADSELKGAPEGDRLAGHESNSYRYGVVMMSLPDLTAEACEQRCNEEDGCAAWSRMPAQAERAPVCELKRNIGRAIMRPGSMSGIAGKFQPPAPVELVEEAEVSAPSAKPDRPAQKAKPVKADASASSSVMPLVFRPNQADLDGSPTDAMKLTPTPAERPAPATAPKSPD